MILLQAFKTHDTSPVLAIAAIVGFIFLIISVVNGMTKERDKKI
jgi:hypothetical protein